MREPNNVKTAGHMGRMKLMMRSLAYIMLKMRCVSVSEGWKRYNASNLLARCISFPFFFLDGHWMCLKKTQKDKIKPGLGKTGPFLSGQQANPTMLTIAVPFFLVFGSSAKKFPQSHRLSWP
jgi:hypothetical protein